MSENYDNLEIEYVVIGWWENFGKGQTSWKEFTEQSEWNCKNWQEHENVFKNVIKSELRWIIGKKVNLPDRNNLKKLICKRKKGNDDEC